MSIKRRPGRLHHTAYVTKDLEATRAFYEDVLGFPLMATYCEKDELFGKERTYCHVFFELADGSALAAGTYYLMDWNLGELRFVDQTGAAVTPTSGWVLTVAGFYADIKNLQATIDAGSCSSRIIANVDSAKSAGFDAELPFTLTDDQRLVGDEIARDLAAPVPMNRLVQGEVGSGKTLVAVRAMLTVAESGGQSALLAPTEVLAAQHLRSIVATLGPDRAARLRPVLLTGQLSQPERRAALLSIASGASRIVVGTHALLGDRVQFADLGLVVVDEQHRFGVEQRESLRRKGAVPPHVLVLTATPIPRTVAMTVFGDLDVSTIATLPAGRTPIVSHVVPLADKPGWWNRVWERMGEELAQGRQGFVVVPAIDPATREDDPDALVDDPADGSADDGPGGSGVDAIARPPATVAELTPLLRQHPALAGRRIEPLHGRMTSDEKDAVMRAFTRGEIDVLVSTTVIEVGVDVPNASTMVVVDADRFGVSQLHQLRGRVGRGGVPGLCLFVTAALPETLARERVEAVAGTLDGFALAQIDLELRREGDVLGATQSGGRSSLKLLRVATDGDLISAARAAAAGVLEGDATLSGHPALKAAIERRLDDASRDFLAKN